MITEESASVAKQNKCFFFQLRNTFAIRKLITTSPHTVAVILKCSFMTYLNSVSKQRLNNITVKPEDLVIRLPIVSWTKVT